MPRLQNAPGRRHADREDETCSADVGLVSLSTAGHGVQGCGGRLAAIAGATGFVAFARNGREQVAAAAECVTRQRGGCTAYGVEVRRVVLPIPRRASVTRGRWGRRWRWRRRILTDDTSRHGTRTYGARGVATRDDQQTQRCSNGCRGHHSSKPHSYLLLGVRSEAHGDRIARSPRAIEQHRCQRSRKHAVRQHFADVAVVRTGPGGSASQVRTCGDKMLPVAALRKM